MLGKKKKIEKAVDDSENSNSLFKECKKEIEEKNSFILKLKKSNESISKYFISILKSLANFSKSLSIFDQIDEIKSFQGLEYFLDFSKESKSGSDIFEKIIQASANQEDQGLFVSELNIHLESIENKLTKLITNLLNTKISKNNNQITKLIDEGLSDEMVDFLNKEIVEENKTLRKELNKLKDLLEVEAKKNNSNETEFLKINLANKTQEIIEINKKLEELKTVNRQTKQKLNSSPYVPYLILEGSYSANIKAHTCLCYFCGFDINSKELEQINSNNLQNETNTNFACIKSSGNVGISNEENSKILLIMESQDVIMNDVTNNNSNKLNENRSITNENEDSNKIGYPSIRKFNENANLNQTEFPHEGCKHLSNFDLQLNENSNNNFNSFVNKSSSFNDAAQIALQNINSPHISTDNDIDSLEKQNLNNLYRRLYEAYMNLKCEKIYSYQNILKSKPFQLLLNQIESAVNVIESQKQEILVLKRQLNENYIEIKSQEKFLKFDKMKEVTSLEQKIENLLKDISLNDDEKSKLQAEITKDEDMIKTLKNFDYSQLKAIEEYYTNKNTNLLEMLKTQAKTYLDKFQIEFEKAESLEKQVLKLTIELDRFKSALSKYESVEGVENLQFEKFDMREREEMKRQIKSYKDKYTNCEKNYRSLKSDLKMEKENSEKLFMEIVLNEKGIEQMNKTIKELTISIQENNEKIGFLLNEKSKNTESIRNLNDYIEKLESEIKDISEIDKEMQNMEENFMKELNSKQEIIKKLEILVKFKNSNIDALYQQISQLTRENISFNNSNSDLLKTIETIKTKNSKKITDLEKAYIKMEKSIPGQRREFNRSNMVFSDQKAEDDFELLRLENDIYKKKLQCKICSLRDIDVIINKCNHTFCRECITTLISSRQRICPKCRCKISMSDVSDIWID